MKIIVSFFIVLLLLISCKKQSEISKDFYCESTSIRNLETVKDVKNLFSIEIPKTWKTNLYFDAVQSSIFTADTVKQLTETVLLDVSIINKSIEFNEEFLLNYEREKLAKNLILIKSQKRTFKGSEAYYSVSIGKKKTYSYKILEIFIKVSTTSFLHTKTEIYGDLLVDQRLCNAIQFIEKIKILPKND